MEKVIAGFSCTIPVDIYYFGFFVTAIQFSWLTISQGILPFLATKLLEVGM